MRAIVRRFVLQCLLLPFTRHAERLYNPSRTRQERFNTAAFQQAVKTEYGWIPPVDACVSILTLAGFKRLGGGAHWGRSRLFRDEF